MYHRLFILVRISNTGCKKLHIRVVKMSKKKTVATAFFAQLDIFDKKRISDLI